MNSFSPLRSAPPTSQVVFAVDDEASDRELFSRRLQRSELDVRCRSFASGAEVIDALLDVMRGHPAPLACFIDVNMAGMSGFDVLRWIRCQDELDSIPVIMLSSSEDPQKLTEAKGVGAQCYVAKFPGPEELSAILAAARRYADDRFTPAPFPLSCNLLLGQTAPSQLTSSTVA